MEKLKKYINQAKKKLMKQRAHACENWGQRELAEARNLINYDVLSQSALLIKNFEKWIDDRNKEFYGETRYY